VADRRSAEVLARPGGTEVLKTSREGPSSLHIDAARTTFQRRNASGSCLTASAAEGLPTASLLHTIPMECMLKNVIACTKSVRNGFGRAIGAA
jgi:hypothetical protein